MNTLFSKSARKMTLKILFLIAFTATSLYAEAEDGKGTLGVIKNSGKSSKVRNTVRRQSPAESTDKGTIGKSAPAESSAEKPGIERAHATEEEPAVVACEKITNKAAMLGRLASKDPGLLENEVNLQLDSFDAKKFYLEPLREYLYVVTSTLAVLEKSRIAGQWSPQLREQHTRLNRIRNELSNEITRSSNDALKAKGCSVLKEE